MSWVYRRPPYPRYDRPRVRPASLHTIVVVLFATADGTAVNVINELDATSPLWSSVDDNPQTPTDSDWVNNASLTASVFFDLTNTPSDFLLAKTANLNVRFRGQNWSGGSLTFFAELFQSDESSSLSDEVTVATVSGDGSFDNTTAITFTGLSAGSKAIWDGARVRFRWA